MSNQSLPQNSHARNETPGGQNQAPITPQIITQISTHSGLPAPFIEQWLTLLWAGLETQAEKTLYQRWVTILAQGGER